MPAPINPQAVMGFVGCAGKARRVCFPSTTPLPGLRKQHDTFGTRGSLVLHFVHEERQWVYIFVRSRLYHIQMQVRTERVSGVSA